MGRDQPRLVRRSARPSGAVRIFFRCRALFPLTGCARFCSLILMTTTKKAPMTPSAAKLRTLKIASELIAAGHIDAADRVIASMAKWAPHGNTCAAYGLAVVLKGELLLPR